MRKRYTAEDRARVVAEVRSSGEGVAAVAKRLGVTPSAAYLWLKAAPASDAPTFARVIRGSDGESRTGLAIEVGRATIRVQAGFDAELLGAVVVALSKAT
jgi:transposase-like protein